MLSVLYLCGSLFFSFVLFSIFGIYVVLVIEVFSLVVVAYVDIW